MNHFVATSINLGEAIADVAERLRRCTVEVQGAGHGRGSGIIWRPDGLIVTNAHVATTSQHTVKLADGHIFQAKLVRRDPRHDLAALQIDATGLPSVQPREATSLRAGELVLAIGNPLDATGAFTFGVVLASPQPEDTLVKADIRLAPGNSGGPLADAQGQVVGINSMVVDGFGFAVTSSAVERFLARGRERSLGVTVQPVRLREARSPSLGMMVIALESGGAAHLAGVLVGDVIVRVNGARLNSPGQLSDSIQMAADALSLGVLRGGRLEVCEVKLVRESIAEVA